MIRRILIVDDDEDDRDLLCEAVARIDSSIECMHAKDGEEALHLLKSAELSRPDLIFLDLNMPRIGGKQCLRQLKNSEDIKSIPVIIYTSSKLESDKLETRALGACHYITKPTKLSELYLALAAVIERKFEEQER